MRSAIDTAPTTAPPPRDLAVAAAPHGARSPLAAAHPAALVRAATFPPCAIRPRWVLRWRGAPLPPRPWRYLLPSAVTLAGLVSALAGALLLPSLEGALLLVLSLLLDEVDGAVARRLNACTLFGARLDNRADLFVAASVAWATWPGPVAAAVSGLLAVAVTVVPEVTRLPVSGRIYVTVAALVWCWRSGAWRTAASPGELAALALGAGVLALVIWHAGRGASKGARS